jgi:hypothetical protein
LYLFEIIIQKIIPFLRVPLFSNIFKGIVLFGLGISTGFQQCINLSRKTFISRPLRGEEIPQAYWESPLAKGSPAEAGERETEKAPTGRPWPARSCGKGLTESHGGD